MQVLCRLGTLKLLFLRYNQFWRNLRWKDLSEICRQNNTVSYGTTKIWNFHYNCYLNRWMYLHSGAFVGLQNWTDCHDRIIDTKNGEVCYIGPAFARRSHHHEPLLSCFIGQPNETLDASSEPNYGGRCCHTESFGLFPSSHQYHTLQASASPSIWHVVFLVLILHDFVTASWPFSTTFTSWPNCASSLHMATSTISLHE
jgi:hypothetical protein